MNQRLICPIKLLACALACIAVPYDPELDASGPVSVTQGEDKAAAETYFKAAQRRLGLLQPSLVAVQCQYLAGLYLKFVVRPLAAWNLLQSGCNQLQALLYARGLVNSEAEGVNHSSRSRHIEQRLYWSCVKAERYVKSLAECLTADSYLASSASNCNYPQPAESNIRICFHHYHFQ